MKAVHPSYTFVASTKTITLTGLNIDQDQLLLIVNSTRGVQYFNFADSTLRGTVTPGASTTVVLTDASTTGHSNSDALVIYYDDQAAVQAVSGTVTANPGTGAFTVSGTVGLDNASLVALENITVTVSPAVLGTVTISNLPATQAISGTVTANLVGWDGSNLEPLRIGGFSFGSDESARLALEVVGVNGGAVTASLGGSPVGDGSVVFGVNGADVNAVRSVIYSCANGDFGGDSGAPVDSTNPLPVSVKDIPAISGTVTANLGGIAGGVTMPVRLFAEQSGGPTTGQDTLLVCDSSGRLNVGLYSSGGTDAISYDGSDSFVKTKNLANPSGALTTRFGSVTTANTAQISAVTNASRKFLLVQNIATSTVTIGIGFSPTTTQGIQLAAGAGLTFDAFCPTGAVYWLSGVTGTNWSVLEG